MPPEVYTWLRTFGAWSQLFVGILRIKRALLLVMWSATSSPRRASAALADSRGVYLRAWGKEQTKRLESRKVRPACLYRPQLVPARATVIGRKIRPRGPITSQTQPLSQLKAPLIYPPGSANPEAQSLLLRCYLPAPFSPEGTKSLLYRSIVCSRPRCRRRAG